MPKSASTRSATAEPETDRWGVRSADCLCEAAIGASCTPEGDHLDRYVRAAQQGRIARETLKQAVGRLAVIAPQAVVPSSTTTADREGMGSADRIGRHAGKTAVADARRDRELEAGA